MFSNDWGETWWLQNGIPLDTPRHIAEAKLAMIRQKMRRDRARELWSMGRGGRAKIIMARKEVDEFRRQARPIVEKLWMEPSPFLELLMKEAGE